VTPEQLRAAAQARVLNALERIERAQGELASACADLSSLVGGIPVWRATSKLHDRVKALWHRVENFRRLGRFQLDSVNVEALERREATSQQ